MSGFRCNLCPHKCNIDRSIRPGKCGVTETRIARASLHEWEEPYISGKVGSGTIFFCGCNMRCVFCQNHEISWNASNGKVIDAVELSKIMLTLSERGAANINLVTPEPHIMIIRKAIELARKSGLTIPIVLNTNSYLTVPAVKSLEGYVDIYLADLKYYDDRLSGMFSDVSDYFSCATAAISEMYRQVGILEIDEESGLAKRGLVLRHLVLPGNIPDSRKVLEYISEAYPDTINVSLMSQYFPSHKANEFSSINRTLMPTEYKRIVRYAIELGLKNVMLQKFSSASDKYVPKWNE